jgi:hypothetical protein
LTEGWQIAYANVSPARDHRVRGSRANTMQGQQLKPLLFHRRARGWLWIALALLLAAGFAGKPQDSFPAPA